MKITFISNFLNHHQLPLCKELCRALGNEFRFVAMEPVPPERLNMGYHDMNEQYDFCIRFYKKESRSECMALAASSDIVVIGSAPDFMIRERINNNKLTFRYAEHYFKGGKYGFWRYLDPRVQLHMHRHHAKYSDKPLYMLCASGHTANDYALFGAYRDKVFRWGYFPEFQEIPLPELMADKNNDCAQLLWCGRFLSWKHPEMAIRVAEGLKRLRIPFHLSMIGNGPEQERMAATIEKRNLSSCVELLGVMPPEKVREHMRGSNIFLMTSDRGEGWGAVVNEAMNSACAVVADKRAGSVGPLLRHRQNGVIYKHERELLDGVLQLIQNRRFCREIGEKAYSTIAGLWNPQVAAARFITLSTSLLEGGSGDLFEEGPCSKIENKRFDRGK